MADLHTRLKQLVDACEDASTLFLIVEAVVRLHEPMPASAGTPYRTCAGCDWGDYADGPPAWPCRTTKAVARVLGAEATDG